MERADPYRIYDICEAKDERKFNLTISQIGKAARVQTTRFDRQHGCVYNAWLDLSAPDHILPADAGVLRKKMELDVSVKRVSTAGGLLEWTETLQPFGVTLLEITRYQ